jgi:hypothetical protein
MALTEKRLKEIIREETERFISEEEELEDSAIHQKLIQLSNEIQGHIDLIEKGVTRAAQKEPHESQKLIAVLSLHTAFIRALKDVADIL